MKIATIIPAYNEEKRIQNVLNPIVNSNLIQDIIVVDDGSKDNTSLIVKDYSNITLIQLPQNKGKAEAIRKGLEKCNSDIILLLDADLVGLNCHHIESLISPILKEDVEMTIGIFKSGRMITDLAQRVAPNLSGQRAFRGYLAKDIVNLEMTGYNIEVAISKFIKDNNIKTKQIILKDISHIMKEEKLGFSKGMVWRLKMYKDILKYWLN
ncbi:glycosyltransferase family 2 protein [Natronincola ferrireducens]|uniref:Glycosyl transferase family 2 n=1 Tax=Natronincola ferrireducens TaxID=393762 RepID=A0A1G9C5E9_9FIRM|nr:glycosyltransferase family 2 protein [Natronincola ferrireducens]SDK46892.1 Glycosyl transferase family 2 [Natronincola ferrireducens]